MEAKLIVVGGKANKRQISLKLPMVIGRSREAGLTVDHPMVSRRHCELSESNGLVLIRDLGSLNGTFVGAKQINEAPLRPADEFTVGPVTFRVEYKYAGEGTAVEGGSITPSEALEDTRIIDAGDPSLVPTEEPSPAMEVGDELPPSWGKPPVQDPSENNILDFLFDEQAAPAAEAERKTPAPVAAVAPAKPKTPAPVAAVAPAKPKPAPQVVVRDAPKPETPAVVPEPPNVVPQVVARDTPEPEPRPVAPASPILASQPIVEDHAQPDLPAAASPAPPEPEPLAEASPQSLFVDIPPPDFSAWGNVQAAASDSSSQESPLSVPPSEVPAMDEHAPESMLAAPTFAFQPPTPPAEESKTDRHAPEAMLAAPTFALQPPTPPAAQEGEIEPILLSSDEIVESYDEPQPSDVGAMPAAEASPVLRVAGESIDSPLDRSEPKKKRGWWPFGKDKSKGPATSASGPHGPAATSSLALPESHSPQPAAEVPPAVPAPAAEVELPEKEHPGSALEPELSPAEQTEKNFDPDLDTFLRGIQ